MTLFWINPFLCAHEITHTHAKRTTYPKFQAHERKGRQQQQRPSWKNNLQNCTRRGFSVPSSHRCAEPETTETNKETDMNRNNTNGTEQSENQTKKKKTSRNHRSKQQIRTTTPPAINLHTPQNQKDVKNNVSDTTPDSRLDHTHTQHAQPSGTMCIRHSIILIHCEHRHSLTTYTVSPSRPDGNIHDQSCAVKVTLEHTRRLSLSFNDEPASPPKCRQHTNGTPHPCNCQPDDKNELHWIQPSA